MFTGSLVHLTHIASIRRNDVELDAVCVGRKNTIRSPLGENSET